MVIKSACAVEVYPADEAATLLYEKKHGQTPDLPDKLRGVFWFSTNAAPELMMTFEGSYFDPERNMLKVDSGGIYNWSYSTGCVGWIYWAFLRISYIFCSELHINFEDDEYKVASMPLYVCGCCHNKCACDGCWAPMGMWWGLEQEDENTWGRPIYLYCMPWQKWETGSYTLCRIIDQDGNKLPAFDEMMQSIEDEVKIKGINAKPLMQILNGDDWSGHLCGPRKEGGGDSSEEPDSEQALMDEP